MSPANAVRLSLLQSAPLNSWVALSQDETRIVATARTLDEVVAKVDEIGEPGSVILKTPFVWGPIFG